MKKLLAHIIVLVLLFSSLNTTFAQPGYIEELLDLNYGPEEYSIELSSLEPRLFQDNGTQKYYQQVNKVNEALKDEIMSLYRNGNLDYNTTFGIISAHQNFVYHLNGLFDAVEMKEQGHDYGELDDLLLSHYKSSRIYYKKIKTLLVRNIKK